MIRGDDGTTRKTGKNSAQPGWVIHSDVVGAAVILYENASLPILGEIVTGFSWSRVAAWAV